MKAYTLLEREEVVLRERVRLGNDRDDMHTRPEALHDLNVERLEPVTYSQLHEPLP